MHGCPHCLQYCSPYSCLTPLVHTVPQQLDRMRTFCASETTAMGFLPLLHSIRCLSQYAFPCDCLPHPWTMHTLYFVE